MKKKKIFKLNIKILLDLREILNKFVTLNLEYIKNIWKIIQFYCRQEATEKSCL